MSRPHCTCSSHCLNKACCRPLCAHSCSTTYEEIFGTCRIYQHNGGGGAFLSVGFFRSLPGGVAAIKKCIIDRMVLRERAGVLHNLSGDTVFTGCTWQVAGLGPSTEAPESPFLDWAGPNGMDKSVWELTPYGHCDEACQWEAGHTISKHVNSRAFTSLHLAAHHLRTLVQMHEAAM